MSHPWHSSVVMAATVVVVVWTHDLAQGVLVGVLLSGIFFASKVRRLFAVRSELSADGTARTYLFTGPIFFASVESFLARSEERRVGKECVSTCSSRWSPYT